MPLQPIERGSLASSDIVNDNFEYLDGKITDTASTIQGIEGRLTSQIQTVSNNKANLTLSNVTSLSTAIKTLIGNDYAKKDLSNSTSPVVTAPYVKTTYTSGTSGYRIWSDGYCEQWGAFGPSAGTSATVTFLKTFKDTNYYISVVDLINQNDTGGYNAQHVGINGNQSPYSFGLATIGFRVSCTNSVYEKFVWKASGYLASGQY